MTEWQSIVSTGVIQNSYGSFVRSGRKPPQEMIQHFVDSSDTLQGISLRYGVKMEDLRRINKLHYTDSILSRQFLNIPVSKDMNVSKNSANDTVNDSKTKENLMKNPKSESKERSLEGKKTEENKRKVEKKVEKESTVHDFLQKLDMQINSTKQIASSMLSDKEYELPKFTHSSPSRYSKRSAFENSVQTTFSNPQSYHNQTEELYRL